MHCMRHSILAILAASHISVGVARAAEAPVLAPSSPWRVDYADEECRLLRTFGTGADAVTMRLARGSGLQSFDMVIAGTNIPRLGDDVKVTLKLETQGTVGSPGQWITNNDYPRAEMVQQIEGTVTFQLKVNSTGAVEKCVILHSSNAAALDQLSCKLMMQRAKFTPALDANDQPITSFYVNRIRWQIPR